MKKRTPEDRRQKKIAFNRRKFIRRDQEFIFPLTVYLSDTNAYGNVYFAKYIEWQGKTREDWFKTLFEDNADIFMQRYKMITVEVQHKYKNECLPFDKIEIGVKVKPTKMCLHFHFNFRFIESRNLVGIGYQKIAFRDFITNKLVPVPEDMIAGMKKKGLLPSVKV